MIQHAAIVVKILFVHHIASSGCPISCLEESLSLTRSRHSTRPYDVPQGTMCSCDCGVLGLLLTNVVHAHIPGVFVVPLEHLGEAPSSVVLLKHQDLLQQQQQQQTTKKSRERSGCCSIYCLIAIFGLVVVHD